MNVVDKVLDSILNNKDTVSVLEGISAAEILRKLQSHDIDKLAKCVFLGPMLFAILDMMKVSDFKRVFDKVLSEPATVGTKEDHIGEQRGSFENQWGIQENDKRLVGKIIEGMSPKLFKTELGISPSYAYKRTRALWLQLGLRNREEMIYLFGYLHLINLDLQCFGTEGVKKYEISEKDRRLLIKIIEGVPLRELGKQIRISPSNVNRRIRRLWQRLGLESRDQLIFFAAWTHQINLEMGCLKTRAN